MRKSRFTKAQIVGILKELKEERRLPPSAESIRSARQRCTRGDSQYGGLETSDLMRLKQLEEENRRLKSIVADQALNIEP